MTTITLESPSTTGRLEELVDRLLAALLSPEPEIVKPAPSLSRGVHEAAGLRQSGDLEGALALLADVDSTRAPDSQRRWLYAEWLDIARRRFADGNVALYSPATGRAAVLVERDDGSLETVAALGLRWPGGQDLLPAQPARTEAAGERRCVMVAAYATVDIADLKARNPLGDAVEAAGVALRGKGRVRQGVCPFHKEVEGSFTVYSDSEKFWCFGCGAGGDVLDFVGRMGGLTLPEAIRRLDDGSPPLTTTAARPAAARQPTAPAISRRDPVLLTAAVRFYGGQLRRSRAALEYLASRSISLDTARRLGLGYATGHGLREHLQAAGFTDQRLRSSGLFLEEGRERFAGMVVVPDLSGGLAMWLGGQGGAARRQAPLPGASRPQAAAGSGPPRPRRLPAQSSLKGSSTG